jgi:hypothetical protein
MLLPPGLLAVPQILLGQSPALIVFQLRRICDGRCRRFARACCSGGWRDHLLVLSRRCKQVERKSESSRIRALTKS